MLYAYDKDGEPIEPSKGAVGKCPTCESAVKAKCGRIKVWHFAHEDSKECDPWSEGETTWHIQWKKRVPRENAEVVIGCHRADIRLNSGLVIELQNSSISLDVLEEREEFYGDMVWLVNCIPIVDHISITPKDGYETIDWKWLRKVYKESKRKVYLDLGSDVGIFEVKKFHKRYGWGYKRSYDFFCDRYGLKKDISKL